MVDVKFECKLVLPFKKIIEKRLKEDAEKEALKDKPAEDKTDK